MLFALFKENHFNSVLEKKDYVCDFNRMSKRKSLHTSHKKSTDSKRRREREKNWANGETRTRIFSFYKSSVLVMKRCYRIINVMYVIFGETGKSQLMCTLLKKLNQTVWCSVPLMVQMPKRKKICKNVFVCDWLEFFFLAAKSM